MRPEDESSQLARSSPKPAQPSPCNCHRIKSLASSGYGRRIKAEDEEESQKPKIRINLPYTHTNNNSATIAATTRQHDRSQEDGVGGPCTTRPLSFETLGFGKGNATLKVEDQDLGYVENRRAILNGPNCRTLSAILLCRGDCLSLFCCFNWMNKEN